MSGATDDLATASGPEALPELVRKPSNGRIMLPRTPRRSVIARPVGAYPASCDVLERHRETDRRSDGVGDMGDGMTMTAFAGHAGRHVPLPRWRSVARSREMVDQ